MPDPPVSYHLGDFCVARYSKDQEFYRGRIAKIDKKRNSTRQYYVIYVDFGNSEWVNVLNLRPLTKELSLLPAQAIACSLDGVLPLMHADRSEPYSWNTDVGQLATQTLINILAMTSNMVTVIFRMKDCPTWPLSFINLSINGKDVAELMDNQCVIKLNLAGQNPNQPLLDMYPSLGKLRFDSYLYGLNLNDQKKNEDSDSGKFSS